MRKVIETQIELERSRSNGSMAVINDSPEKSSCNESPDTSDNPKSIPANIEIKSLSALPVCKHYNIDNVGNTSNTNQRDSVKKSAAVEDAYAVPFSK